MNGPPGPPGPAGYPGVPGSNGIPGMNGVPSKVMGRPGKMGYACVDIAASNRHPAGSCLSISRRVHSMISPAIWA